MSGEAAPLIADLGIGIDVRAAATAIDEVAAGPDRTAEKIVAKNLTTAARGTTTCGCRDAARRSSGRATGLTTLPGGTLIAVVALGGCRLGRLGGPLLL